MKLQVAIDRVTLDEAVSLANKLDGIADIIEFGTSLVKDYGFYVIKETQLNLKNSQLLLDTKTNDEGDYEFKQGFNSGADILTVMGSAGKATLDKVYKVAEQAHKTMLIDLMGLDQNSIKKISNYPNAIYNLHNSHDVGQMTKATAAVAKFNKSYPWIKRIAIAGGIDLKQTKELAKQGLTEIVIVGGKIIKTDDPVESAKKFKEIIKSCN